MTVSCSKTWGLLCVTATIFLSLFLVTFQSRIGFLQNSVDYIYNAIEAA